MHNNTKELIKYIDSVSGKYDRRAVFCDFIEMMAIALSNRVDKTQYEPREARYMQIVKNYDRPTLEIATKFLGKLTMAFMTEAHDYLGEVYMELGVGNTKIGQYFTPMGIAEMMAEFTLNDKVLEEKKRISVYEPTSGSGVMIIGMYRTLQKKGYVPLSKMEVYAQDLSLTSVHMSYIQCSLLGIPGQIVHGNTLSNEIRSRWFLPYFSNNDDDTRIPTSESDSEKEQQNLLEKVELKLTEARQLSLF